MFVKKIFVLLVAAAVLLSSFALAEDLSSLPDEELLDLYMRVTEEIETRYMVTWQGYTDRITPAGIVDEDAVERINDFFRNWARNGLDDMLALCAPSWKAYTKDPKTELFKIHGNRTPINMEIIAMFGDADDTVRTVSVVCIMDRNNRADPKQVLFQLLLEKDADGLWYINPESLLTYKESDLRGEPDPEPTQAPDASGSVMLYYSPDGGRYYHADRNCKSVNPIFLPLQGSFSPEELEDEAYKDLMPCNICGAPLRP